MTYSYTYDSGWGDPTESKKNCSLDEIVGVFCNNVAGILEITNEAGRATQIDLLNDQMREIFWIWVESEHEKSQNKQVEF